MQRLLATSEQCSAGTLGVKSPKKVKRNTAMLHGNCAEAEEAEKKYASLGAPPRPGGPKENCKQFPPTPWGVPPAATYATGRNKTWQPLRHTKPTELSTAREL